MSDSAPTLLPPNASALERAVERLMVRHLTAIPNPHRSLWSAQDCPAALLPWLALSLGIQTWREDWPEETRRNLIAGALTNRHLTGTTAAVEQVVRQFGGELSVVEWWQKTPKGEPHTFDLVVTVSGSGTSSSSSYFEQVINEVNKVKPLRSHMTAIQGLYATGRVKLAAVGRPANYRRMAMTLETA